MHCVMKYIFLLLLVFGVLFSNAQVRDFTQKTFNCDSIPKAFTPNGDGVNDLFSAAASVAAGFEADSFSLRIFNRWGELMFEARNILEAWDGKNKKQKPVPEETYIYLLIATDRFGMRAECKGSVLVLR
jgi:gliding motility-associated-like protein